MHLLHQLLLCLVGNELFRPLLIFEVAEVEPALEGLPVSKDLGEEEVQQGPQLLEIVLQGGSGDEEARGGGEGLELAEKFGVKVLHAMSLVL